MSKPVHQALALWGLGEARADFVARRENEVWKVIAEDAQYALRLHRPGYRTHSELWSELIWMQALAEGGLAVPRPIPLPDGTWLGKAGGHPVSLLTWCTGAPIGAVGCLADASDPAGLGRRIGRAIARLHDLTDAWQPPRGFTRPDWRASGLLGDDPLWGRFWDHPHLQADQRDLLLAVRDAAREHLNQLEPLLDQGLIHADLLAENILTDGDTVTFIDFDDAAFGYRDFELATLLLKFRDRPYCADLRAGLCAGYAARREVSDDTLDFILLLRALTYPGWIAARLDEPGAGDRSRRAIDTALALAQDYLERRTR